MTSIELNMVQTAGIGALALMIGMVLTRRVSFLQKFCVPSPVTGGLIFSLLTLALYAFNIEVSFDKTLQDVFMIAFFTCVGYQCDLRVLKKGGKLLGLMLLLLVLMITLQDLMPLGITRLMGANPLLGIASGSVSMTGGHGTAGGFAGILEQMGLQGAATISMAAATFGLIAGSMVGGPLANSIIRTKLTNEQMQPKDSTIDPAMSGIESDEASPAGRTERMSTNEQEFQLYAKASYWILLAMGGGTLVSWLLAMTGVTFPTYFGALILAAIIRNTIGLIPYKANGQWVKADKLLDMERLTSVGNICLSLFLGMAMISLRLWELQNLALPLVVILAAQVVMMVAFVYFIAFPILGRTYDAAVLCAGMCGFGLGATPNAMANMSAVCYKYHYTAEPFLVVPILGAMFADIINTGIISLFLRLLS